MKNMSVLGFLVLCLALVKGDGVCYDPDHVGGKSAGTVQADLATIRAKGFSHVRTYICKFGGTDMAALVAASGLRSALGVPYPAGDWMDHARNAANAAKSGTVDYIFVGNENLGGDTGGLAAAINTVKGMVGGLAKVGTVQTVGTYLNPPGGMDAVLNACDAVGVNVHPWFTANRNGPKAIQETGSQWSNVKSRIGDKLVLTETGWPSAGSAYNNYGSVESAADYFQAYKSWSSAIPDNKKFYFQMFDQPQRGGFEGAYGLLTANGQPKYNAAGNPAPAPAPAPVPTPAPTPVPTTPTPTTVAPTKASVYSTGPSESDSSSQSSSGSLEVIDAYNTSTNELGLQQQQQAPIESTNPAKQSTSTQDVGKNDTPIQANTQTSASSGSVAGIIVIVALGCAAVFGAFGFIYKARQRAAALDNPELKDSMISLTPLEPASSL